VKTHISRVLTTLELRDRVRLVVFAHEHGLVAKAD
jgi:DNA-binding NarL/FixJ family response regulator